MLTAAITGAVVAILTAVGVEPGPYIAGVAVGVKIMVVTPLVGGFMWWKKKKDDAAAALAAAADAPAQPDQAG